MQALFDIDGAGLRQALRLALAAWIAFAIATLLGIPHAYWAAMPVWVVVQPSRGLLLERAVFRFIGTLIGAAAGLAALRLLPNPVVVILMLGLWVGLSAALVHILRGVQSYGVMLAGMTAAIVILPTVLSPDGSFDLALARVACTLIGVVVVTLVLAVSTPWAERGAYDESLRRIAADAVRWAARCLDGAASGPPPVAPLAPALAAATTVTAGSMDGYRRYNGIIAELVAVVTVLARAATLGDRRRRGEVVAVPATAVRSFAERLEAEPPSGAMAAAAALTASDRDLGEGLSRLALREGAAERTGAAEPRHWSLFRAVLSPQRDSAVAVESGLVVGLATTASALAGLAAPWHAAELAALGVCIFTMVMTSLPAPRRAARQTLAGVAVGLVFAVFYRFAIQPHVASVPGLIASLAPFLLLGGFGRVGKRTAIPAIDANMCFLLVSQPVLGASGGVADILGGAAAFLAAALVVFGLMQLLPDRAERLAIRTRRAIRRDLARLASAAVPAGAAPTRPFQWQLGRLSLRLVRAAGDSDADGDVLIGTRRLGDAIAGLRVHGSQPGADAQAIARALAALSLTGDVAHGIETLESLARGTDDIEAAVLMRDAGAALAASGEMTAGFAMPD